MGTDEIINLCLLSPLYDGTAVNCSAEIGVLGLRFCVSRGASLGDFLLAPVYPIEKVTLWEGLLYLTSGTETDNGIAKDKKNELRIEPGTPGKKPSMLSTRLLLHPINLQAETEILHIFLSFSYQLPNCCAFKITRNLNHSNFYGYKVSSRIQSFRCCVFCRLRIMAAHKVSFMY